MKIYRSADVIEFRETIGFVIKRKQEVLKESSKTCPYIEELIKKI